MLMDAFIALRAAGVGLLLDISAGQLPAVLHWGGDPRGVGPAAWGGARGGRPVPGL